MAYHIIGEWLCQDADGCTCGMGGHSLYPHEPLCGVEQVAKIADLIVAEQSLGRVTAEIHLWRNQISGALGMTDPDQWHTATLPEVLARIKEIIASRGAQPMS